jgi:hypothetical protein
MSTQSDDLNNSSSKLFFFNISNGVVTAYSEVEDDENWTEKTIDSRDSFAINGNQITHTKQTSSGPEVTVFADPEGDGYYTVISGSHHIDDHNEPPDSGEHKAFKFTIENEEVKEVFEFKNGDWELESISDNETYTVANSSAGGVEVIRTEVKPFGTEITHYADLDGDESYNRTSEQWQNSPNAPGNGHFVIQENLKFSPTDGDDLIAVRGDEDCHGGNGADDFVVREATHLLIGDFKSQENDRVVFDTGLGLTSVQHLQSFVTGIYHDGQNLVVDFGANASITLMGVQPDQIGWEDVSVLG